MKSYFGFWILIIGLCGLPLLPGAQVPITITTEELNVQKLFIEANRAKLLGTLDEAEALYREVLAQDPRNHAAIYELSRVLDTQEKYDEALDQIKKAVRLAPDNSWYLLMQADVLERTEDFAGAIEAYIRLLEIKPDENYFYEHLVDLYMQTNQSADALATLNRYESRVGVLPSIINRKTEILENSEQFNQAIIEHNKLLELYPENVEYLHRSAELNLKAGNTDAAYAALEQIIAIDATDSKANLALAGRYKTQGQDSDYLKSVNSLMVNPAIDIETKVAELIPFLERYVENGDEELGNALDDVMSQLVQLHGDDARAHALYADYLYHSGRLEEAATEYERTLALDKRVFQVWEQLLYIKLETGDTDGLLEVSSNALNYFPNQASLYYLSGIGYAQQQDFMQASNELQQALIMSANDDELQVKILGLLGSVYESLGDEERSIEAYNKAVDLSADDPELLIRYAEALANAGQSLTKAAKMAESVLATEPDNHHAEHVLALIAFKKGDYEDARTQIASAMEHGAGDNFASLELYGDILYNLAEIDQAVEYWQLSLDGGNNSPYLKRKISERKMVH